jgi:hypothetical protein
MRSLLEKATEAGRAVLLVADHGHVRAERMVSVGFGTGAGKRYRWLSSDEAPRPGEIALGRETAWVQPGKSKVAMLVRECDAYGTPSATGEHGGASIAEVVAPAILIGSDVLHAQVRNTSDQDDPELLVAPFARPDWWDLQLPTKGAARAAPMPQPAPPKRRKSDAKVNQVKLPLDLGGAPAEPVSPPPPAASPVLAALRASEMFADRSPAQLKKFREVVAPRVALLVDAGGAMPLEVFARKAGVLPTSVGGVVAEMQEWVNFDGYAVVEHDPVSRRVAINLAVLYEYVPGAAGG